MTNLINKNLEQVAEDLNLKVVDNEKLIDYLKIDILLSVYRRNPKNEYEQSINNKIARTYEDWTGRKFESFLSDSISPTCLFGPPGHGKTTVMLSAAKMVADSLGMNFVKNPKYDFVPTHQDFFLCENRYDINLSNEWGGGVLLFENLDGLHLKNLYLEEENAAITAHLDRLFQGENIANNNGIYVGATENLYKKDIENENFPLRLTTNRLVKYFVIDKLEDFIDRTKSMREKFPTLDIFISFLKDQPQEFNPIPEQYDRYYYTIGFASPRNWTSVFKRIYMSLSNQSDFSFVLQKDLNTFLGGKLAKKFISYIENKVADDIINNQIFDESLIKSLNYNRDFHHLLVNKAVDYVCKNKNQDFVEATERLANALCKLDSYSYNNYLKDGIKEFGEILANRVPKYAQSKNEEDGSKVLDVKWKVEIAKICGRVADNPPPFSEKLMKLLAREDNLKNKIK